MKILVLGAGKMGTFLTDVLCINHEVALFDTDPKRLRFVFNTLRMTDYDEIRAFQPALVINCVTLKYTIDAFLKVLPFLPQNCILSDIASVKTGIQEYYQSTGMPYVSTHPMFGPTFATLDNLNSQSAIIISESDSAGKTFFNELYSSLKLHIFEYSFDEHDKTIAYSLSIPFASTLVFASVMVPQEAPGTTFKRHMDIAKGLLSEDDYLLSEILFNPHTHSQVEKIRAELKTLMEIIDEKNSERMQEFLKKVRKNIAF
ncbi:MAG: prephenate dehydratase [Porphyromonadaceae bacterium CG2_30_38_12]|nr:MAG: prephenate dehydratase [Porphyromonadaceae bacterium CG2_30_38_12]